MNAWTDEEIQLLRVGYRRGAAWLRNEIQHRFNIARTENSIRVKMHYLRLTRDKKSWRCPICEFDRPLITLKVGDKHLVNAPYLLEKTPNVVTETDSWGRTISKPRGFIVKPLCTIPAALQDDVDYQHAVVLLRKLKLCGEQAAEIMAQYDIPVVD